jgi:hypothetical protein
MIRPLLYHQALRGRAQIGSRKNPRPELRRARYRRLDVVSEELKSLADWRLSVEAVARASLASGPRHQAHSSRARRTRSE